MELFDPLELNPATSAFAVSFTNLQALQSQTRLATLLATIVHLGRFLIITRGIAADHICYASWTTSHAIQYGTIRSTRAQSGY
jgi:hypothetical protein